MIAIVKSGLLVASVVGVVLAVGTPASADARKGGRFVGGHGPHHRGGHEVGGHTVHHPIRALLRRL